MKTIEEILNRLTEEARQSQPKFSESLQKRCEQSIRSCNPDWQVQPEKTIVSINNKGGGAAHFSRRGRNAVIAAGVLFCVVTGLTFIVNIDKIGNSNSNQLPCSTVTQTPQTASGETATTLAAAEESVPIPINPEVWESLEELRLLQDIQNAKNSINPEELRGRSASIYASVKKMALIPTNPQEFAKTMLNQDISMGNLMVKTSSLTQFGQNQFNSQNNQEDIEE